MKSIFIITAILILQLCQIGVAGLDRNRIYLKAEYRPINELYVVPGVKLHENLDAEIAIGTFFGKYYFFFMDDHDNSSAYVSGYDSDTTYWLTTYYTNNSSREYGALISPAINFKKNKYYLSFGWQIAIVYHKESYLLTETFTGKTSGNEFLKINMGQKRQNHNDIWVRKVPLLGIGYQWERAYLNIYTSGDLITSGIRIGYFIKK